MPTTRIYTVYICLRLVAFAVAMTTSARVLGMRNHRPIAFYWEPLPELTDIRPISVDIEPILLRPIGFYWDPLPELTDIRPISVDTEPILFERLVCLDHQGGVTLKEP